MANKCLHTCVFDHDHFRKTYQSDILFPPSKIFKTDFGSSYKKSFEYTGICVRGYTKCGFICSLELVSDKHEIHTSHCYFFIFM